MFLTSKTEREIETKEMSASEIGVTEFSTEELLYVASVSCSFAPAAGVAYGVEGDGSTLTEGGEEEKSSARLHNETQEHLGEAYANLVVPGIPCGDLIWHRSADEQALREKRLPKVLQTPVIKTEGGPLIGAQSGIRSGIIKLSQGQYVVNFQSFSS